MTPFEILNRSREFESEEAVRQYMDDYDSKSIKEVMVNINLYAHQQIFAAALDNVVSESVKLLKVEDYAGWVALVRSYQYPILVTSLVQFVDTSVLCRRLMTESMKQKDKCGMLITGLLRYQWMWRLYREDDSGREAEVADGIREMVDLFLGYFGAAEVVQWNISQPEMKLRLVNNDTLRHDRYVNIIREYLYKAVSLAELPIESDDLEYLIFLSQAYQMREEKSKESLNCILDRILTVLTQRRYFWQHNLSQSVVSKMRAVRDNIQFVGKEKWKDVMGVMTLQYEGYKCPPLSETYERVDGECWMYCVLLLLAESEELTKEEKVSCFQQVSQTILAQCHYCGNEHLIETNYMTPLCLAELVVSQVLTECKDEFENLLLDSYMPLRYVVRVLENSNDMLSDSILQKLMPRKSKEWETEKLRLSQLRMKQDVIKGVETYFLKMGIL